MLGGLLCRCLQVCLLLLLGIIESSQKRKDSQIATGSAGIKNTYGEDVLGAKRDDFNLPRANKIKLTLRIVVIKHPTDSEIKFFQTDLSSKVLSSKVIFNERIYIRIMLPQRPLI